MTNNQTDKGQGGEPIDIENCTRMFNGQRDVVLKLVGDLLQLFDKQKKTILEALAERDPEKLRREAHSVKGGAAVLSAGPLLAAATVLEEIGRSGNLSGVEGAFSRLEEEATRLAAYYASLER